MTFPHLIVDLFRYCRFWLLREAAHRHRLLTKVDYLSLASPELHDFLHQRQEVLPQQYSFIQPLPFAFFEGISKRAGEKHPYISIVVPGMVTGGGRDYEMLLTVFQQLVPELRHKVRLTLLGSASSAYAQKVITAFQNIQSPFFELLFFPDIIPQKEFDIHLRQSDFLILPLLQSYRLGIIREEYGRTNISGGINDMIRFGIPTLVPAFYPLDEVSQKLTVSFSGEEDLLQVLREWITDRSYLRLRQSAPDLLANHRREVLAKKVDQQLKGLLSQ